MSKDNQTVDERWRPYQKRFYSLPVYYFASLEFPESIEEARQILTRLEMEISNIDAQFSQREERLLYEGAAANEELRKAHIEWKIKAQKAQCMRQNQVAIVESWIYDRATNSSNDKDRVSILEKRVEVLEDTVKKLLATSYPSA